jgi:hypothetical protein
MAAARSALVVLELIVCIGISAQQRQSPSAKDLVNQMVQAETAAWNVRQHFQYQSKERSNRTNGLLWEEMVVETPDGSLQRLISEDGIPLSGDQKLAEDRRVDYLANHPAAFRRRNQRRREDEARMPELLKEIPSIFLFDLAGFDGDYASIVFRPNPAFKEQSYQDRVVHAMAGELVIHTPDMRLSKLDAHLQHKVEFGFGILGVLSDKTRLSLSREPVSPGQWTTTKIRFHLDGSILLLKSISRDVDSSRYGFKPVAHDLNVPQAAALVNSNIY